MFPFRSCRPTSPQPARRTTPATPPRTAWPRYYTRVLHELIDVGVEIARTLPAQARAQAADGAHAEPGAATAAPGRDEPKDDTPPAPTDIALAYDRITRAVRRTILLARKLTEPAPAPDTAAAQAAARHRVASRKRIIREVEDAIGRATQGSATHTRAETLHAELLDRLDGPDLDEDIGHRPAADIVADICRDLGIAAAYGANPWRRRTPTDIEILCARAAAPAVAARTTPAAQPGGGPNPPGNRRPPRATPPAAAVPPASNPARPGPALAAAPDRLRAPRDPARLQTDPAARPAPAASTGAGLDPPPPRRPPGPPATILPYAARPPDP